MSTTLLKNVASQRIRVYAYTPADGLPKTGDAANLTAYIAKDYGAVTALTDTSATEEDATNAPGYYWFDITQTETNADNIMVTCKSSTSGVKVLGAPAIIGTRPATGFLAPTTAGRTLDVSAGGEAGLDWANVGSPTTSLSLTNTRILGLTGTIGEFDDFVDPAGKVTLNAASITSIWTDTTASDFTAALSIGKSIMNGVSLGTGLTVARCTLTDTLTTYTGNTVQTGDAFARLGAPAGASVSADIAGVQSDTNDIQTRLPAALTADGNIKADMLRVNGTAQTAGDIAALINALALFTTRVVARCTASGVPTTTSIPTSACSPSGSVADQFKGRIIIFDNDTTTAALRGQATDITASSAAATPTFTCTALTTAPASGDTFTIV